MQFITLVPALVQEAQHVSLLISERLIPIYNRSLQPLISKGSLSIFSFRDAIDSKLKPSSFDFQSPIGSICRHRFTDITKYGSNSPILTSDQSLSRSLRSHYLNTSGKTKIVGIS